MVPPAASVFHFNLIGIPELKDYLKKHGVPIRQAPGDYFAFHFDFALEVLLWRGVRVIGLTEARTLMGLEV